MRPPRSVVRTRQDNKTKNQAHVARVRERRNSDPVFAESEKQRFKIMRLNKKKSDELKDDELRRLQDRLAEKKRIESRYYDLKEAHESAISLLNRIKLAYARKEVVIHNSSLAAELAEPLDGIVLYSLSSYLRAAFE